MREKKHTSRVTKEERVQFILKDLHIASHIYQKVVLPSQDQFSRGKTEIHTSYKMGDAEGNFELMGDELPVHQGEASMSANNDDSGTFTLLPDYAKKITRITIIVATASLLFAVLAMWWCASQVAYIAFVFPLVTAPAVVVQRIRIQWMPSEFVCLIIFCYE